MEVCQTRDFTRVLGIRTRKSDSLRAFTSKQSYTVVILLSSREDVELLLGSYALATKPLENGHGQTQFVINELFPVSMRFSSKCEIVTVDLDFETKIIKDVNGVIKELHEKPANHGRKLLEKGGMITEWVTFDAR